MDPKIIAIANTKGGTGKTTIALQLAAARALQGKDVCVIDGDRQQTASMALTLRDNQKVKVFISCMTYSNGTLLGAQVKRQAEKWDTIFIDVGGFDSATMRMALAICDMLIIPFQPRTFDSWALTQMKALIDEVNKQFRNGDPVPAFALINGADTNNSADNQEAADSLADFPDIKLLDCPIGRRKAFANASALGLGVAEAKNKDPKAIAEIDRLMLAIFDEVPQAPVKRRRKAAEAKTEDEAPAADETTTVKKTRTRTKKGAAK